MLSKALYPSPLRYPGGKTCLADQVKKVIDYNQLNGIAYAEPFTGGAGLALTLLLDNYVSQVFLNDLDSAIFSFWSCALEETSDFCRRIIDTPVNLEQWYHQKKILNNQNQFSTLDIGFATFFLNRTNRSGIIEGGIIGGKEQDGDYKLDCRFNKRLLVSRIEAISKRKQDIFLTRLDAKEFIRETINNGPHECFSFIDPPYYKKGHKLYYNSLDHQGHLDLSLIIQNELRGQWLVTYDDVPEINAMYDLSPKVLFSINYSAQVKQKGREVMYHSANLHLPENLF